MEVRFFKSDIKRSFKYFHLSIYKLGKMYYYKLNVMLRRGKTLALGEYIGKNKHL